MILGSTIQVFRGINRKLIFEAATDPKQRSCFPKMSSVFLSHRFCGRCSVFVPLGSRLGARVRLQQPSVLTRTQRRFIAGRSVFFRDQSKSKLWICGVGVGVALAVGLQYSKCDHKVGKPTDQFRGAIEVSRELLERIKVGTEAEVGAPGLVVGVSVDGSHVWSEGLGYADLENRIPCTPETVMRIASISKPLTAAAAALLCEEGKLKLDVPVQEYVPEFPQKHFDGKVVTITPRMLLSHLSGIRHYEKDIDKIREDKAKAKQPLKHPVTEKQEEKSKDKPSTDHCHKDSPQAAKKKEFDHEEYYLKENFESVTQALNLFKDDPLVFEPGSTFLYSTHAFTLLSAVMERAAGQRFLDVMMNMFRELGMLNTTPDENDRIIYRRSRFYCLNKKGRVVNSPYVDNSYKWAGGGFLSTVGDLLQFGNALLYSYQVAHLKDAESLLPGFLKPKTAVEMWTPVDRTEPSWDKDGLYAQGWLVVEKLQKFGQCRKRRHYVSHTGGAVGASSVLLVLPSDGADQNPVPPRGVVVTIVTNMQSVGLNTTALKIALEFDKARNTTD
ncbi:serine beta-lactamase-like protein LACTB, mitochondrial isoform X1 [Oryzias melastigma]|uniref:serine beta-lactamase-like protein LACTB, mitochondrial isoform X1 n=1 Tax=Oryzias melastigma TaxID=30732 RepID=UPI000CF80DCD|nr:serine beta-lactamase-like protein LACTB, mitochondrial isoform X1 [Oryzias melastigma]